MVNEPEKAAPAPSQQQQQPADAPKPEELKLSRTGWAERARTTFEVSPHAIAGALHDVEDDAQLAEAEVRERLKAFAEREAS